MTNKNYFWTFWNMSNMWSLLRRIRNIQKQNKTFTYKTDLLSLKEIESDLDEETAQEKMEFQLMKELMGVDDYESAFKKLKHLYAKQDFTTRKSRKTILNLFEWSDELLQNRQRKENIRRLSIAVNNKNQEFTSLNNQEINIQ